MKNRKVIILGVSLVFVILLFAFIILKPQAQDKNQQQDQDEATVVQRGQVTVKEREYSKEYRKLYSYRSGSKLTWLSELGNRRGNKQEVGVSIGVPIIPTIGGSTPVNASNFLKDLSCKADVVVIGLVNNKAAHLTDDETFVYTEYEFSVEDILKNNSAAPIKINNSIQITRPGGLIRLDNQVIRVEDKLYEPLQMKKRYLLFLKFVPSVNGYIVSDAKGDFLLENNSFKKLSKIALPGGLDIDNDSRMLFSNIRASILTGCEHN
ncbi:MAG: hypothetical protein ACR2N3_03210 [Pyrinomonadaceae bacterium]